jgi:3-deoxy-manno-octulosonate cytidylyltransferase (CMP-KDO synthetase)
MVRALGVIPARFASTRFPGKPLAPLGHRTLVEEVWARTRSARRLARVVVATEDERIVAACRSFGAEAMMTSANHASGTDRVAEVAERAGESFEVVLNVQGDEPFVTGTAVDRLVEAFDEDPGTQMATLSEPLDHIEDLFDPNAVKVVQSQDGRALYFSRSPVPYHRAASGRLARDFTPALAKRPGGLSGYRKHQGIYAYRRDVLFRLTKLPPSPLERDEGLEQLRALENGVSIRVLDSDFRSVAVDTPEDLERVIALGLAAKEARA